MKRLQSKRLRLGMIREIVASGEMYRFMRVCQCETGEFHIGQLDGPADGVGMRERELVPELEKQAEFKGGGTRALGFVARRFN